LRQVLDDQQTEWWKAKEVDDFNLKKKLLRVGCRPLKRKYLACLKQDDYDEKRFYTCKVSLIVNRLGNKGGIG